LFVTLNEVKGLALKSPMRDHLVVFACHPEHRKESRFESPGRDDSVAGFLRKTKKYFLQNGIQSLMP
jgi:hypothetical protein